MANKYNVIVEAMLKAPDIQNQLNKAVKSKPIVLNAKMNIDQKSMDNQVQRWQNTLKRLEAAHPKAFGTDVVQNQVTEFNNLVEAWKGGKAPLDDVTTQMDNVKTTLDVTSRSMGGFADEIGIAIQRTIEWALAMGLLYGSLKQIQEGIQYIKDLNKELTDAAIVGGYSQAQVGNLAKEYNALARELGVTTLEVAKGNLEWVN